MADRLTLEQLLEVMKPAFEKRFDCDIDLYTESPFGGVPLIAIIHFKFVGVEEIDIELYKDATYRLLDDLHQYRTDLNTLAYVVKNANELLRLLKHCHDQ